MTLAFITGTVLAVLAAIGIAYQVIAFAALGRFFARSTPDSRSAEAVTMLKPLYGSEPRLGENLATFLVQHYAGPMQMLCGVGERDDPAAAVVTALRAAHPAADIALTTGPRAPGANGKIGNLVAMMPAAEHDVLVLSDSDMVVGPEYLSRVLAALEEPGIGAVTCLYAARADAGLWSAISAAAISYTGMPNMVMGQSTAIAQPCMGSTIAMRRDMLERIGGFGRFADVLADDYAIGEAVQQLGLKVAVPPMLLIHACHDGNLAEMWRHHLRWSVTIRSVAPWRHAGSGVTHALAFSLLTLPFMPETGALLVALSLAVRYGLAARVDRLSGVRRGFIWLLPLADCLEFSAFVGSFLVRTIDWRGSRLTMTQNGRIADRTHSAAGNS